MEMFEKEYSMPSSTMRKNFPTGRDLEIDSLSLDNFNYISKDKEWFPMSKTSKSPMCS